MVKNDVPEGRIFERILSQNEPQKDVANLKNDISNSDLENLMMLIKQYNNGSFEIQKKPISRISTSEKIKQSKSAKKTKSVYLLGELRRFWDYDNSEYIKKKQLRGYDIQKRNYNEKLGIVNRYYTKCFTEDKKIQDLTTH
ncbi:MAG: hypothetical protein K6E69_07290 [Treponema sp.]|uniref:hypothetical protein n=1 Tax=Treponema sp. TaxID=166 RepID=UPI00298E2EC2|nr:hypothetical protein [Treponema sp.]MCR5386909.1 hypothetical protein [Treponema sp.]